MHLQGRSLLTLTDFSRAEINHLLELSARVKHERRNGRRSQRLAGYTLAMIFEKQSTRTRSAFETAFGEEGGYPVFLGTHDIHLGKKESIEENMVPRSEKKTENRARNNELMSDRVLSSVEAELEILKVIRFKVETNEFVLSRLLIEELDM